MEVPPDASPILQHSSFCFSIKHRIPGIHVLFASQGGDTVPSSHSPKPTRVSKRFPLRFCFWISVLLSVPLAYFSIAGHPIVPELDFRLKAFEGGFAFAASLTWLPRTHAVGVFRPSVCSKNPLRLLCTLCAFLPFHPLKKNLSHARHFPPRFFFETLAFFGLTGRTSAYLFQSILCNDLCGFFSATVVSHNVSTLRSFDLHAIQLSRFSSSPNGDTVLTGRLAARPWDSLLSSLDTVSTVSSGFQGF